MLMIGIVLLEKVAKWLDLSNSGVEDVSFMYHFIYFLAPPPVSPPTYKIHRGDNKRDNLTMRFVYINIFICTYRSFEVYLFSRRKGCYLFEERKKKKLMK